MATAAWVVASSGARVMAAEPPATPPVVVPSAEPSPPLLPTPLPGALPTAAALKNGPIRACRPQPWPPRGLVLPTGELLQYAIEVDGLNVGKLEFRVLERGTNRLQEVRSVLEVEPLAATLLPAHGQAAALLDLTSWRPRRAMMTLSEGSRTINLSWAFDPAGRRLRVTAPQRDRQRTETLTDEVGVLDVLSTFYSLRALDSAEHACLAVVTGAELARLELERLGDELRRTPVGLRPTGRYRLSWTTRAGARRPHSGVGDLWVMPAEIGTLPLEVEVRGRHRLRAVLSTYQQGGA